MTLEMSSQESRGFSHERFNAAKSEWINQINVSKMSAKCQLFFMIL